MALDIQKLKEMGLTDAEAMQFMQKAAGAAPEDEGGFYQAASAIGSLSGPERQAAIAELSADYEGRKESLRDDLTVAYDQFSTPNATSDAGPAGNPYAVTIAASPLEHLAVGVQKYMGAKDMKEAKAGRENLSKMNESGLGKTLNSMADDIANSEKQAIQADLLRKKKSRWSP